MKRVCGKKWFNDFVSTLSDEDRGLVGVSRSNALYRFGDSEVVYSYQNAKVPAYIGGQRGFLEAEVVDTEIPLFISKDSIKRIRMILDFTNDTATINGKQIKLEITSNGHYLISLSKYN